MQFYIQRQISELLAITSHSTKWMEDKQAPSSDRQDLAEPRTKVVALIFRFRVISQDPKRQLRQALPMVVGSSSSISNKWPSQSQTRGCCPRSPVISQLGQDKKPSFLQAQDAPTEQCQQNDEFLCNAVPEKFPCGQNKDTIKTFL